ncbi:MAG: hypothetical protein Q8L49_02945 [Burkholderiaceae bacterium]|nr:hypothetical protein [Burkholderiaceae bacterium]
MTAVDLPAHVTVPDVCGRLPRDSLHRHLRQTLWLAPTRLVWIHGGPGWGKTSFAAAACRRHDDAATWLRLDDRHADPAALLSDLQQALHAALPASDLALPMLSREQLAAPAVRLRQAFRAMFAALPARALLVLDDVQTCGDDDAIAGWLNVLVEECRAGQRVMAVSRRGPPDQLARLVLTGAVVDWPARGLAFCSDEVSPWLVARGADASQVLAWVERCQGWPAAVMCMPCTPQSGQADRATAEVAPRPDAPDSLAAFIDSEVLQPLPADARALLEACAWLPVIDLRALPALGVASASADAAALLERLASDAALVDRVAQTAGAARWRLHDLLRERLRHQALRDEAPAVVAARIEATARWLESDSQDEAALACWFDAAAPAPARWFEADRLLQRLAPAWLSGQRQRSLRDAALRIPESMRSAGLWWRLAQAQAPFNPAAARGAAERALALWPTDAKAERLHCLALVIASYFQAFDSTTPLAHWMGQLESQGLDADKIDPEQHAALAVGVFSAMFLRTPTHPALATWQSRARAVPTLPVNPDTRVRAAMLLAKQGWYNGRHHDILPLAAQVEGALTDAALSPYSRLVWCLLRQYEAWARADWPAGLAAANEGIALARASGIHLLDQHLRLHAACFAALAGDPSRADTLLAEVARHANPAKPMECWHHFATRGWLMLRAGRHAEAEAASALAVVAADAMGPAPRAMALVVRCHALRALDRDAEALLALLDVERAAAAGNLFAAAHAELLRADLALAQDDRAAAHSPLARAFAIVREQGLHALFGVAPDCLARLAAAALDHGIEADSVVAVIRAQRLAPPPQAGAHWPWPVRVRTLGRFEVEIDGTPLRREGKTPQRPLDLLQALIAHGGRAPVAWLVDALWPQSEGDRANDAFEVALRRLRKLLGNADALRLSGGELALDARWVWVDALHWRGLAETAGDNGLAISGWSENDFLPDQKAAWVYPARARLAALRQRASQARQPAAPRAAGAGVGARAP